MWGEEVVRVVVCMLVNIFFARVSVIVVWFDRRGLARACMRVLNNHRLNGDYCLLVPLINLKLYEQWKEVFYLTTQKKDKRKKRKGRQNKKTEFHI